MTESNETKSFITSKGGFDGLTDAHELTWVAFLKFSRKSRSRDGGWNSKTHWWKRGVRSLADDSTTFLKQWTENSLEDMSPPRPRTGQFKFNRYDSEPRKKTEQKLALGEKAPEHALNYALFLEGLGMFEKLPFEVSGYEIPLAAESMGQKKVDLFGVSRGGDAIEIVELKKANNTADSPLMALTEAICYALQTLRCMPALLKEEKLKSHRKAFEQIKLTILAPANYWNYWSKRDNLDRVSIREKLETIVKHVESGIKITGRFPDFKKLELDLKNLELAKSS